MKHNVYVDSSQLFINITCILSQVLLGAGVGVLRVFCADVHSNLAVVPVDYVNNALIAAAWDSTERKKNGETEIPVYTMAKDLRFG